MQEIHEAIEPKVIDSIFKGNEEGTVLVSHAVKRARQAARTIRNACQSMDDSPPWRFALLAAIALEGYADAIDKM